MIVDQRFRECFDLFQIDHHLPDVCILLSFSYSRSHPLAWWVSLPNRPFCQSKRVQTVFGFQRETRWVAEQLGRNMDPRLCFSISSRSPWIFHHMREACAETLTPHSSLDLSPWVKPDFVLEELPWSSPSPKTNENNEVKEGEGFTHMPCASCQHSMLKNAQFCASKSRFHFHFARLARSIL